MGNNLKNNKSALLDYSGRSVFHSVSENLSIFFHSIRLSLLRVSQLRCSLYRKSAFTFAELMISLVVISILAAVLYPNLMHFNPNSNKPLFKAAYKTLSNALAEVTVDKTNGNLETATVGGVTSGQQLCIDFCRKANVMAESGNNTCGIEEGELCNDRVLTTTNGMRWLFENYANYSILEYYADPDDIPQKSAFRITVDVNSSNNKLAVTDNDHKCNPPEGIYATADHGVFCYDNSKTATGVYTALPVSDNVNGTFNLDNVRAQDTFQFLIDEKGKIISISPVGWAILEDSIQLD